MRLRRIAEDEYDNLPDSDEFGGQRIEMIAGHAVGNGPDDAGLITIDGVELRDVPEATIRAIGDAVGLEIEQVLDDLLIGRAETIKKERKNYEMLTSYGYPISSIEYAKKCIEDSIRRYENLVNMTPDGQKELNDMYSHRLAMTLYRRWRD